MNARFARLLLYGLCAVHSVMAQSLNLQVPPACNSEQSPVLSECKGADADGAARPPAPVQDKLERSRQRAREYFEQRKERERHAPVADGSILIEGERARPKPSPERSLSEALAVPESHGGIEGTWLNADTRMECIASCSGPMCCVVVHLKPDPAHEKQF